MSYSKLKVSSQENSLSVYFPFANRYFSFDSQTACIHNEATVGGVGLVFSAQDANALAQRGVIGLV